MLIEHNGPGNCHELFIRWTLPTTCCNACEWRENELFSLPWPPHFPVPPPPQHICWVTPLFLGKDPAFSSVLFHRVSRSPLQKGSKPASRHMFELVTLFSLQIQLVPLLTLASCWGLMPYLPQDSLLSRRSSVSLRPKAMPVCCLHSSTLSSFDNEVPNAFLSQ